jgi:hypothetical protein
MIIEIDPNNNWKPIPTEKAPQIDKVITAIFGIDRKASIENKTCATCGMEVKSDSFKNEISLKEFHISGMCQTCQDGIFG